MLYGIENYILGSPLSLINGLILFIGISYLGNLLLNYSFILREIFTGKYYFLHSSLVGINFVLLILYFLTILKVLNFIFFKFIAIILILLGIYFIVKKIFKNLTKINSRVSLFEKSFINLILILILGLYFLLSLYPFSHADALHYHGMAAIFYLNEGKFPTTVFDQALVDAGIGELLISLGLSVGSGHFSNIIQFAGILSILAIFFKQEDKSKFQKFLVLSIISSPVIIFFLTSSKPQFLLIINSLVVFSTLLKIKNKEKIIKIIILFSLLAINVLSKFSFIISGSILSLLIFYKFYSKISPWKIFFASSITFVTLILPFMLHRYIYFQTDFYLQFLSHLPINYEYYKSMSNELIIQTDGKRLFPIFLLLPLSVSSYTTTLGCSLIAIIFLKPKENKLFLYSALLVLFFYLIYGPNVSRFVFEPIIFILYLVSQNYSNLKIGNKIFTSSSILQSFASIIIIIYSISLSLPASLYDKFMIKFMNNYAYGYQISDWVNKNLDSDISLLSDVRSISLINNNSYHYAFNFKYIDKNNVKENKLIKEFLKEKKIKYILTTQDKNQSPNSSCLGDLILKSDKRFPHVSRNPLNKDRNYNYYGYIYKFDLNKFPNCLDN